jgi:hypothetical protein
MSAATRPATYDPEGYNADGLSSSRHNRQGLFHDGWHYSGRHGNGTSFDDDGFTRSGLHKTTGTFLDPEGSILLEKRWILRPGYDGNGLDSEGRNCEGFDADDIHGATGTEYNLEGRDVWGQDSGGFDEAGFYMEFYREPGRNPDYEIGWHRDTKTSYDPDSFDTAGVNEGGIDSTGVDWGLDY